jgi:hypothetical protein
MTATPRSCVQCGGPIPAGKRADARTCSDQCRWARRNDSRVSRGERSDNPAEPSGRPAATAAVSLTGEIPAGQQTAQGWEPVIEPRRAYVSTDPCPDCGTMLIAGPRGTWRACPACRRLVVLPAIAAPYQNQPRAERRVISQRERDLEAIGLAARKGRMLAELDALNESRRLSPESATVIEWYAAEVRAAQTQARLDDLADLAASPESRIRQRHWWQPHPAAIEPAQAEDGPDDADQDDDQDQDDDGEDGQVVIRALPGPPSAARRELSPAGAVAALGWRLSPAAGEGCQVVTGREPCRAEARFPVATPAGLAWICAPHNYEIGRLISRSLS